MVKFLRNLSLLVVLFVAQAMFAQTPLVDGDGKSTKTKSTTRAGETYVPGDDRPSNVKFTTTANNGSFKTGDTIRIEANFDDWLGWKSKMQVRLNTGDVIDLTFDPEYAQDIIDPNWGEKGKPNATLRGGHNSFRYGVYCVTQLEGKGGHTENKGKMVLAGGFEDYEGTNNDNLVITDKNGKLLQGFGDRQSISNFNNLDYGGPYGQVMWATESNDGGLLVCGNFSDYSGNEWYDGLVKFKYNSTSKKFEVDETFMNNITKNNTRHGIYCCDLPEIYDTEIARDNFPDRDVEVPSPLNTYGMPDRGVQQDEDGSIYVVGDIYRVAGEVRRGMVKLNADGTVNKDFECNIGANCHTMTFDDDDKDIIWVGARNMVYRVSKTTGKKQTYGIYDFAPGPQSILAITLLPNPTESDSEGNSGPGGVFVTGLGSPNHSRPNPTGGNDWGWTNFNALQDNLTPTSLSKFAPGGLQAYGSALGNYLSGWAVDGATFVKGKMWLGLHDANLQDNYNNPGKDYYEGGLLVMNYNGSLNTSFNHMLANADDRDNYMSNGRPRPDSYYYSNYRNDGIGGLGSGGGTDIIALFVDEDDDLLVGGSYGSVMEYTDDGTVTSTDSRISNFDDQIITRLNFRRAVGTYIVSADDIVPEIEVVEILPGYTINGAFGDEAGLISMDNISEDDDFKNNYDLAVNMPFAYPSEKYVTTWKVSGDRTVKFPMNTDTHKDYKYVVDWGTTYDDDGDGTPDGKRPVVTVHSSSKPGSESAEYTYIEDGTYTIKITTADTDGDGYSDGGGLPQIYFNNDSEGEVLTESGNCDNLLSVDQWGNAKWKSMENSYRGCDNLKILATDLPDLTSAPCTSMAGMFRDALTLNFDISPWDVSKVVDMSSMFWGATAFNNGDTIAVDNKVADKPIKWAKKTGSVTNMSNMFYKASNFNQPVGGWQVEKVTNMSGMFSELPHFDQELSNWKVFAVTDMSRMFENTDFDQDLGDWDISALTNAENMFLGATLSQSNYDKLLIGWLDNAKENVKFHGGSSPYCLGADARRVLVEKGWGDGIAGGDADDSKAPTDGIVDGGSGCGGAFVTRWVLPGTKKLVIKRAGVATQTDISWGDGKVDFAHTAGDPTHIYTTMNVGDTVTIKMFGEPSMAWTSPTDDIQYLAEVVQFGDHQWPSMENMFRGAKSMVFVGAIDIPDLTKVTDMSGLFYGAEEFNSDLAEWDVSQVTDMSIMFQGAKAYNNNELPLNWGEKTALVENMESMFRYEVAFDQDIGGWNISALTNANNMFADGELSVDNYDALLIGWGRQVEAGTANENVKFSGGTSKYCAGDSYRNMLMEKGWGDGTPPANPKNTDIKDGGMAGPNVSNNTPLEVISVFQGQKATIKIPSTVTGVEYYATAKDESLNSDRKPGYDGTLSLTTGVLSNTTTFKVYADNGACVSLIDSIEIKVYPQPDLKKSKITVVTTDQKANGVAKDQIKVEVVDIYGAPISGAGVVLAATENVAFTSPTDFKTKETGDVVIYATSTVAAEYKTKISLTTHNPDLTTPDYNWGEIVAAQGNPAVYTFVADKPDLSKCKLEHTTAGTTVIANNIEYHEFKVTLKDANGNAVSGTEVKFAPTTDVIFTGASKTNSKGELIITARTIKAWIEFETAVSFNDGENDLFFPNSPLRYSYVAGGPNARTSTIVVSPTSVRAGESITITGTALDEHGNVCRDVPCMIAPAVFEDEAPTENVKYTHDGTTTSGKEELRGVTDVNGQFVITASSEVVGTYKSRGTVFKTDEDGNESEALGLYTEPYSFTAGEPSISESYVSLDANHSEANGTEANIIRVYIFDAYGNVVPNAKVSIDAEDFVDWGSGVSTEHLLNCDAEGVAELFGKTTQSGTYISEVSVETGGVYKTIDDHSDTETNRKNPVEYTFLAGNPENNTIEVINSPNIANGTDTIFVRVTLRDLSNNPIPNKTIKFYKTADVKFFGTNEGDHKSLGFGLIQGDMYIATNAEGVAKLAVTSLKAAKYITNGAILDENDNVFATGKAEYTFVPGPPSAANSKVTVVKDLSKVGGVELNKLEVELYDANNNKIEMLPDNSNTTIDFGATPKVSFEGGTAGEAYQYVAPNLNASGTFQVDLSSIVAGEYTTPVSLGGSPLKGSPVKYTFLVNDPDQNTSSVVMTVNGANWEKSEKNKITITIKDGYNNVISGIYVGIRATDSVDYGRGFNKAAGYTTNKDGQVIVNVSAKTAQSFETHIGFNREGWDMEGTFKPITNPDASGYPLEMYFVDNYTSVDVAQNIAMRAKWYVLKSEDAKTHTKAQAIEKSGAKVWLLKNGAAVNNLTVKESYFPNLNPVNTGLAGPYKLDLFAVSDDGETIARSIVASVVDDQTVFDENKELAVRAQDYLLSMNLAKTHTNDLAKSSDNGNVKAWSLSDYNNLDLLSSTNGIPAHINAITNATTGADYSLGFKLDHNGQTLIRTVKVTVVADGDWFKTTWTVAAGEKVTIPTFGTGYDFSVDWGDGSSVEELVDGAKFEHTYATAGTYTIGIVGEFPRIYFNNSTNKQSAENIQSVKQWGNIKWESMENAFYGCINLMIESTAGNPDLSGVKSLASMFKNCEKMNSITLNNWNVSTIENMSNMFEGTDKFDRFLRNWNVSKVTDMSSMFENALLFNQDLSMWNVSKVANMSGMFNNAERFDQNIGGWNISALSNADSMFYDSKLSVNNYDALLIGWEQQVAAGTAKQNVKFHGGASMYCAGNAAHESLVAKGWGDGLPGGNHDDNTYPTSGIVDGGRNIPASDMTFGADFTICTGNEAHLVLSHSEVGVEYQLFDIEGNPVGAPIDGTDDNTNLVTFVVTPTAVTTYYVVATNATDGACTVELEDQITISLDPVSAVGTLTSNVPYICAGQTVDLTIASRTGKVEWQRYNTSTSKWVKATGSKDALTFTVATEDLPNTGTEAINYRFRAFVKSGECSEVTSNEVTIAVAPETQVGTLSSSSTAICVGTLVSLELKNSVGDNIEWERSTDGGTTWATAKGSSNKTTLNIAQSDLANTGETRVSYQFRASVTSGVCDAIKSNTITITVDPVVQAGTIAPSDTTICVGGEVTLRLSGHVGTVEWQRNDGDDIWMPATNSSNTTNFTIDSEDLANAGRTQLTYQFRAVVTSGVCGVAESEPVIIKVDPQTLVGTIAPLESTICEGSTVELELSDAVGRIEWQRFDDASSKWIKATASANNLKFTVSPLDLINSVETQVSYKFRASVTSGTCETKTSNEVTIKVDPETKVGTLTQSKGTICVGNTVELTLDSRVGKVEWQRLDGANWVTATGSVDNTKFTILATDLSNTGATQKTYKFRASVTSGVCNAVNSNEITVKVDPETKSGTLSPSESTICVGKTVDLSLADHVGTIVWQRHNGTTWVDASGTSNTPNFAISVADLTNSGTTQKTYQFRASVTSGTCETKTSNEVTVKVDPATNPGEITPSESVICAGETVELNLAGSVGTIVWQRHDGTNWVTATGDNGSTKFTLSTDDLANTGETQVSYQFRASVTSGTCSTLASNIITVKVDPSTKAGTLSPSESTICVGKTVELSLAGHVGTIVWQRSIDGTNWAEAKGTVDNKNFTISTDDLTNTGATQKTYQFRASVTSGTCETKTSNVIRVNVDPATNPGTIETSEFTICAGEIVSLSLTGSVGTIVWQRYDGTQWITATGSGDVKGFTISTDDLTNTGTTQKTYKFRASVTSGTCETKTSNEAIVKVDPTTMGGTASATAKICNNRTTDITLSGYVGEILYWEMSTGKGWEKASPDGAGLSTYTTAKLTNNSRADSVYQFRAVVQSGVCEAKESTEVRITVLPKVVAIDYYATISDGKPITINPLDSVKYSPVTFDAIGTPDQGGTATLNGDKSVYYAALRGFVGTEKFKYYLTVDGLCQDSAFIYIKTDCLPHTMADLTMELCLGDTDYNINLVEYMPYTDIENVSVWDESGTLISNPKSYPSSSLKANNTTVFTYYYERAGFCIGSEPANIYINAVSNNRTAIFGDKTISVCGASLKDGGYKLGNLVPYLTSGGDWNKNSIKASGTTVAPGGYLLEDVSDGFVFNAQAFWDEVVSRNGGSAPAEVSVTIEYVVDDTCVGNKKMTLTMKITRDE
ncbi:MAG: BspA family leucine-rich repeat surface protein [Bacteroidales bacterium]